MSRRLSAHFTVAEAMKSQTATRHGIDNTPPAEVEENLKRVAEAILEPVRGHFGRPFSPNSWYRCPDLNAKLGSKPTSQHVKGEAVDLEVPGVTNLELARWIEANLDYDQLLLEFHDPAVPGSGWVHVSLKASGNRKQSARITKAEGFQLGLTA